MIERKIYRFSCQHCRQERVSDMPVGPVCFGDGDSELATAAELIANGWRERRCQVCDRPTWIQLGARRYAWRAPADPITGAGLRPGAITPQGGTSHAVSPHLSAVPNRARERGDPGGIAGVRRVPGACWLHPVRRAGVSRDRSPTGPLRRCGRRLHLRGALHRPLPLCEVVLEHASSKCAARTPTGERMLTLGKQVLEHSTAHGVDVIEAIAAVLSDSSDGENRKLLEMMRKTMADSERPSPCQ